MIILEIYPNENYVNDLKYIIQYNRVICPGILLGICPETESSFLEHLKGILLISGSYFLLDCES